MCLLRMGIGISKWEEGVMHEIIVVELSDIRTRIGNL